MGSSLVTLVTLATLASGVQVEPRAARQTDRTEALLDGSPGEQSSHPLHTPSGEKTRKTYDFTRTHHVGTSCADIQASQGATKSGVYLIHPPNLAQGPWKVATPPSTSSAPHSYSKDRTRISPELR